MASEGYAPLPWYLGRRKGEEREKRGRGKEEVTRRGCVCVCERERSGGRNSTKERARERKSARACVRLRADGSVEKPPPQTVWAEVL